MNTVYIKGLDWTATGAPPELAAAIAERGYRVVNAPRPLPCHIDYDPETRIQTNFEWVGDCRHGTFYAAGPADDRFKLADRWDRLDAWPVEVVDEAEIWRRLRLFAAEQGYADADIPMGQWKMWADYLELPRPKEA